MSSAGIEPTGMILHNLFFIVYMLLTGIRTDMERVLVKKQGQTVHRRRCAYSEHIKYTKENYTNDFYDFFANLYFRARGKIKLTVMDIRPSGLYNQLCLLVRA